MRAVSPVQPLPAPLGGSLDQEGYRGTRPEGDLRSRYLYVRCWQASRHC
jgi:hypothetical protein